MLTVWNVRQRKQIASKRVDSLISDLAWEPRAARLMAIGEEGAVYDWQHAVPAGLMERSSPLDELADCLGDDDLNGAEKGSPLKRTYSFDIGARLFTCAVLWPHQQVIVRTLQWAPGRQAAYPCC